MEYRYTHNFSRHYEVDGVKHDRLESIQAHGIVSPLYARKNGIPFKQEMNIRFMGIDQDEYDDVIFLYKFGERTFSFGNVKLLVADSIDVLTQEDMKRQYGDLWVPLSFGEVYTKGRIDPSHFTVDE